MAVIIITGFFIRSSKDYIKSISSSGIKYIGWALDLSRLKVLGVQIAYTTKIILIACIYQNLKIAVMVNASKLLIKNINNAVKNLFVKKFSSKIDLVRLLFT